MKRLSELVDESCARDLKRAVESNEFPGVRYEQALELLLSDGIVPADDLPVASLLRVEDWARNREMASPPGRAGAGVGQAAGTK